jgi:hypothetical protein
MSTQILVCVNADYPGDPFDAVTTALEQAGVPAAAYECRDSLLPSLIEQAKRALFEAEQTYPGIADRPEMQELRGLLGLGEAPPPDRPL